MTQEEITQIARGHSYEELRAAKSDATRKKDDHLFQAEVARSDAEKRHHQELCVFYAQLYLDIQEAILLKDSVSLV